MWFFRRKKVKIVEVPVPDVYFMSRGNVYLYDVSKKHKYACLNLNKGMFIINKAHSKTMNVSVTTKSNKNDNMYITGRLNNSDNYYISITKCLGGYNKREKVRLPIYRCEVNVTINAETLDLRPYPPHNLYVFK
jgi:hypothetical protein